MNVLTAITQRASTRAFLDKPVERAVIQQILDIARWAPSGKNSQPWHVVVLQGEIKNKLSQAIIAARHAGINQHPDYEYYAKEETEPYITRRKECGIALYKALNIQREDTERRKKVWEDNYYFFHAPIGLIFYMDKNLEKGSFMDIGMFIQNVMLAALQFDLATCPQAALSEYPDTVREHLQISDQYQIICGMSLGYPDKTAPINNYRTSRAAVEEFTTWK